MREQNSGIKPDVAGYACAGDVRGFGIPLQAGKSTGMPIFLQNLPGPFFPFSGCHVLDLAELLFSRLPGLFQVKVGL
jgi:hypothetical protein